MYERILVALKQDEGDDTLVEHASGLARLTGGCLILVHAIHSHSRDAGALLEERAEAYLAGHARRLAEAGVAVETMVARGGPAPAIRRAAQQAGADLIVMGSHGHREVRHVLLGSVTETVIRGCDAPVLLVRP